jgi:hypothetical protein
LLANLINIGTKDAIYDWTALIKLKMSYGDLMTVYRKRDGDFVTALK